MKLITPLHRLAGLIVLLSLVQHPLFSQTNFLLEFSTEPANPGDEVCISVRAYGFEDIVGMQFGVKWPFLELENPSVDFSGTEVPGYYPNDVSLSPGLLRTFWVSSTGLGVSLPDGALLFYLCFKVKTSEPNVFIPIALDTLNFTFEVVQNADISLPYVFLSPHQRTGGIFTGFTLPADPPLVTGQSIKPANCAMPDGAVQITVQGGQAPYRYRWSGPGGYTAGTANITGVKAGEYAVTVTDQRNLSVVESFKVKATPSTLTLSQVGFGPAVCGAASGHVEIEAQNGTPPYQYQWSDGYTDSGKRNGLSPGIYSLTVTDAVGCLQSAQIAIYSESIIPCTINGSPHLYSCAQQGNLEVVFNDPLQAPYMRYQWSNGATTRRITQLSAGTYTVTVSSPGGCTAERKMTVYNYYIERWTPYIGGACQGQGTSPTNLTFKIYPININFPIDLSWSNGSFTHIEASGPNGGTDTLRNLPPGIYALTVTDKEGCSKVYDLNAYCSSSPALALTDTLPFFYLYDEYLHQPAPIDTCIALKARNFRNLTAIDLGLAYPWHRPNEPLITVVPGQLPGLDLSHFKQSAEDLELSWQAPGNKPVTVPDSTTVFKVCLKNLGKNYFRQPNVGFSFSLYQPTPRVLNAHGKELAFACRSGYSLSFEGHWNENDYSVCGIQVEQPSCTRNGFYSIRLVPCGAGKPTSGNFFYHTKSYFLNRLSEADSGLYYINTNTAINSLVTETLVKIPYPAYPSENCVWPGDADDNRAANHHDLLYLGLGFYAAGPRRPGAHLDWVGQDAPAWDVEIPGRKVDYRNIDTNGDGFIDFADTLAIAQNWGRVVNTVTDDPFGFPAAAVPGSNPPPLQCRADTLNPGQTALLPLYFGTNNAPADSVYGLAFSIAYDPRYVSDLRFLPTDSWMGAAGQLLHMQRNFPEQGRLDLAITRMEGKNAAGSGPIGHLRLRVRDVIPQLSSALYLTNPQCIDHQGAPRPPAPQSTPLYFRKTVGIRDLQDWAGQVSVVPNPARSSIHIESDGGKLLRIEVLDLGGALRLAHPADSSAVDCSVETLAPGAYLLRVFGEAGVTTRKLVVVR